MALKKQIVEVPITGGLEQKFAPQRLPSGKSAKAQNLVLDKAGRLSKRLGYWQLSGTDPFGSGYTVSAGVDLGTWNGGSGDNLLIVGRGNRPGTSAPCISMQTYSDDLGGPILRDYMPDVEVLADNTSSGSLGNCYAPQQATIGDYMVTVWIDPATEPTLEGAFAARAKPPLGSVGMMLYSVMSVSTKQQIVGPTGVDGNIASFPNVQFIRLAAVGNTFVLCFSATKLGDTSPYHANGKIIAKYLPLSTLTSGGGWQSDITITTANAAVPNPYPALGPPVVYYPPYSSTANTSVPAGMFDMKAVLGSTTRYAVAYETGTFSPTGDHSNTWGGTNIVVDIWDTSSGYIGTWTVAAAPSGVSTVGGFGVRADSVAGEIVLCWAQSRSNNPYYIYGCAGNLTSLTGGSPVLLYTAIDSFETVPSWIDVSQSTGSGSAAYMESHSPAGACWNAAFTSASAVGAQGVGATATANIVGAAYDVEVTTSSSQNVTSQPIAQYKPDNALCAQCTVTTPFEVANYYTIGEYLIQSITNPSGTITQIAFVEKHSLISGAVLEIYGTTSGTYDGPCSVSSVIDSHTVQISTGYTSAASGGVAWHAGSAGTISVTPSGFTIPPGAALLSDTSNSFSASDVGKNVNIVGASAAANKGQFAIIGYNSGTKQLIYMNPQAVAQVGSVGWGLNGGSNYTSAPTISVNNLTYGSGFQTAPVLTSKMLYQVGAASTTISGVNYNTGGGVTLTNAGANYSPSNPPQVIFDRGGAPTTVAILTPTIVNGQVQSIAITNGGAGYTSVPDITIVDSTPTTAAYGGIGTGGTGATATATVVGGVITAVNVTSPGINYGYLVQVYVSGGATGTVNFSGNTITGITVTNPGAYYQAAPNVTIVSPYNLVGLQQSDAGSPNRLVAYQEGGGGGTTQSQCWFPSNNARIIQNKFTVNLGTNTVIPDTYCSGTGGSGGAIITNGVTLASCGLEANGLIYYMSWVPSFTQGSFIMLASDLSCNASNTTSGASYPMRPVAAIQTRTALSDPGYGFQQPSPAAITFPPIANWQSLQTPQSPNCWTGGSSWSTVSVSGSTISTVAYVSSSMSGRLAPAYGQIQSTPTACFPMSEWGDTTAIGGALPSIFDGQNVFEQGFMWAPESIIAVPINMYNSNTGALTWTEPTDTYSWIFTWEHFDAQGNFHISPRGGITITGQDLINAFGPGTLGPLTSPYQTINPTGGAANAWTGGIQFIIPTLGVTNRMWPGPSGSDLRAYCSPPSASVTLGVYRTLLNGSTFYRVGDRFFNSNDIGDSTFTMAPPIQNIFYQATYNTNTPLATSFAGVGTVNVTDGLSDKYLGGPTFNAVFTSPLLYGDGTNGNPGSLDNYRPPATQLMASDKTRLYVANGNGVWWTKSRTDGQGPGYNESVNFVAVGDDDPIVGLTVMDDKVIIIKTNENWYLSGNGPADDGSGGQFVPNYIPTDLGCISGQSVLSTPEGVYYQSPGGLRLIDRALTVRYIGGPVEDELNTYPYVMGCALQPQKSRMIVLANATATNGGSGQITGEIVVRDYVLDAWSTFVVNNAGTQTGFISATVANGLSKGHTLGGGKVSGQYMNMMAADGSVWREHATGDSLAYYDQSLTNSTYVSSTWITAPILGPSEGTAPLQSRFRLWDIIAIMNSADPHGLNISVTSNYGGTQSTRSWVWNNGTQVGSIAPGGTLQNPLTQLRTYDGRLCESFQLTLQDVVDTNSVTGQGAQFLGLTLSLGTPMDPFKLPAGGTQ